MSTREFASLDRLLAAALGRRRALREPLADTDCYRLFHGIAEGCPGLSVDRYGPVLLAQTWREPLTQQHRADLMRYLAEPLGLELVWNHRGGGHHRFAEWHDVAIEAAEGQELGVRYDVRPRHGGQDPLLHLDSRCLRRRVREISAGKSVLNLFAYTCGLGVCAALGGASDVWNVDFAGSALAIGRANGRLNHLADDAMKFVQEDALCVVRQLAGLGVGLRRGHRHTYVRVARREFDLVVLDPPRWSTGRFGAVDVVRDYQTLFKPALLATRVGGSLLVTNHHPGVDWSDWIDALQRCGDKVGRRLRSVAMIPVEDDFPSFDGRPPLKVASIEV